MPPVLGTLTSATGGTSSATAYCASGSVISATRAVCAALARGMLAHAPRDGSGMSRSHGVLVIGSVMAERERCSCSWDMSTAAEPLRKAPLMRTRVSLQSSCRYLVLRA